MRAERVTGGGYERDERRLVGVAKRRVLAADNEIEFVAEKIVAVSERYVNGERECGERERNAVDTSSFAIRCGVHSARRGSPRPSCDL
jgi:hypothetical protein